jgi:chloramphenicol-sensitive protein RarD
VTDKTREGFLYGLAAYGLWGLVPLYFRWLNDVPSFEIVAHRVVWSAVFLAALLVLARRWPRVVECFRIRRLLLPLTASACFVGINWLVYILSVEWQQVVQSSLGYYMTPLVSVLIGLAAFRERLRPLQWFAVVIATAGVVGLTVASGGLPWIALVLAVSFGLYGAVRKKVPVDGLTGLSVETGLLAPFALAYLAWLAQRGEAATGADPWGLGPAVALSGVITTIPLLCFGQAARRLPLSTLGFLQYLSPTVQLVIAVWHFREPPPSWGPLVLIWVALAIFSADSFAFYRRAERQREAGAPQPEVCET